MAKIDPPPAQQTASGDGWYYSKAGNLCYESDAPVKPPQAKQKPPPQAKQAERVACHTGNGKKLKIS